MVRNTVVCALLLSCAGARPFVATEIVWEDDDRRPIPEPESYWSPMYWDVIDQTLFEPVDRALQIDVGGRAVNVNALGEVPSSSWFTNRLGLYDMTPEQIAAGPCREPGINEDGVWLAKSGKVDGANPGFVIEDTTDGRRYLLKFDSTNQPERATTGDVIGSKVYWAFGFSAPCNQVVHFELDNLAIADDASKKDRFGNEAPLTQEDVDQALASAPRTADGRVRGSASLFLPGKVLGPFRYHGTRPDDANDVVRHEDRRELRGSFLLAAWLNHFDARENNTLTTFIREQDSELGYVQHHLIDFGDCFGSEWAWDGMSRRFGHSYYLDIGHVLGDILSLGTIERPWERAQRYPEGSIFGYFDIANFSARDYKPAYLNVAFNRMDREDGYWAARIISRFSDEDIRALVGIGRLTSSMHARYLERVLIGRRDIIVRQYLYDMSALDEPRLSGNQLCLEDTLVAGGYESAADSYYTVHVDGEAVEVRVHADEICVAVGERPAVVELRVRRAHQAEPADPVRVHVRDDDSDRPVVVGVER